MCQNNLTPEEKEVLDLLGEAFEKFKTLPQLHSMDLQEFCIAVHNAERIIISRPYLRNILTPIKHGEK